MRWRKVEKPINQETLQIDKSEHSFSAAATYPRFKPQIHFVQISEDDALFPWSFLCLISSCRVQDRHQKGMRLSHQILQLAQEIKWPLSYDPGGGEACFVLVLHSFCALCLSKVCHFPQRTTEHFHFGMRKSRVLIIQHLVNIDVHL